MSVDMSPRAVTARLRRVSELRDLCLALAKAGAVDEPALHGATSPSPETKPGDRRPVAAPEPDPAA